MLNRDIHACYYDIESLENVFTIAIYRPAFDTNKKSVLDVYYILDESPNTSFKISDNRNIVKDRIYEKNKNFNGDIHLYNLKVGANLYTLAKIFGVSKVRYINGELTYNPYRTVCDTDKDYDDQYKNGKAPYLFGYNSSNYDITMLAWLFANSCMYFSGVENKGYYKYANPQHLNDKVISAKKMREFNDVLFGDHFKKDNNMPIALQLNSIQEMQLANSKGIWAVKTNYNAVASIIRKNMLMTGRNIDVARLPGKQTFMGLKRLLGMLGYQILESEKLDDRASFVKNIDEVAELIAYNASDVINLELLFYNDAYKAQFDLKRELLNTYKEIVYEAKNDSFNGKNAVMPSEKEGNYDEDHHAYEDYAPNVSPNSVRGDRLFIDSSSAQLATRVLCPYGQLKDMPTVQYIYPEEHEAKRLGIKSVDVLEETKQWIDTNLSGDKFAKARKEFQDIYDYYASLRGKNFNNSSSYNEEYDIAQHPELEFNDIRNKNEFSIRNNCMTYYNENGEKSSCYVNFSIGGIHGAEYNQKLYKQDLELYETDPMKNKRPVLFTYVEQEKTELNPRYAYTSCDQTNHEDFTSYYPNLLRRMRAFWNNGLGYDRYGVIFDQKQKYGKLMKDKSLSEEERHKYAILREGTKLILNSASGAADATFESNIRMNNRIIAMRIIGQLFTFRIGMAQSLKGAKIISTNTDGLYSVLEEKLNNKILAEESKNINVEIEPEPIYLISKDSNNRIEATLNNNSLKIESASGGTVACRKGPNPQKSLDHPAIVDWALAEYISTVATSRTLSMEDAFDMDTGREILYKGLEGACVFNGSLNKKASILNSFQMMFSSNPSSYSYKFGITVDGKIANMQHYNRGFILNDDVKNDNVYHIKQACARVISDKAIAKRVEEFGTNNIYQHNDLALKVLDSKGLSKEKIELFNSPRREAVLQKVSKIGESWNILIENHNLNELDENYVNWILMNLDIEKYLEMIADSFNNSWRNKGLEKVQSQLTLF
jgi:hypothetical protein